MNGELGVETGIGLFSDSNVLFLFLKLVLEGGVEDMRGIPHRLLGEVSMCGLPITSSGLLRVTHAISKQNPPVREGKGGGGGGEGEDVYVSVAVSDISLTASDGSSRFKNYTLQNFNRSDHVINFRFIKVIYGI